MISFSIKQRVLTMTGLLIALTFFGEARISRADFHGAALTFHPASHFIRTNETTTVLLAVRTDRAANAVEARLRFPPELVEVQSISTAGSVLESFVKEPTFSNTTGAIEFSGWRLAGITGSGPLIVVTFRGERPGIAHLSIDSARVLAADGKGTNIVGRTGSARFEVSDSAPVARQLVAGDLVKLVNDGNPATSQDATLYYYGRDGMRYVFPDERTYFTWYPDFARVKIVSTTQLASIPIGGTVTYRPGVRMVKVPSDPRVYVVTQGGIRRHVGSEAIARELYGAEWSSKIHDLSEALWSSYKEGAPVTGSHDYSPVDELTRAPSMDADKSLRAPAAVTMNPDGAFVPQSVVVLTGQTVRFTNTGDSVIRVRAPVNPEDTSLPRFDSGPIHPGYSYVYRFTQTGTWGIQNVTVPAQTMLVTVIGQ